MSDSQYDLLVSAGRVFCSATGLDGPGAVAVRGGRIVAAGSEVTGSARETFDFPDCLLLPGLVDVHAHPALRGSKYGIDPDVHILPRGVTTVLSQGDAGASNWSDYRETIIEGAVTRVFLAINLSASGESKPGGCFEDLSDVDVDACVAAIEQGGDAIWGIAVNISTNCCGATDPREIMKRARAAADRTGRPLLYGGRRNSDLSLETELESLESGDVVTYCFHGDPENILSGGRVRDCVRKARERGVLFDIGHGMGSFSFATAEAAIADGFLPDTISTDQYHRHVGSVPQHDLPLTLSKLIAAGMSERDAFARVTARPASLLGLEWEVGTLAPGACADLAVLRWNAGPVPLRDTKGDCRPGGHWRAVLTVRAGVVIGGEAN